MRVIAGKYKRKLLVAPPGTEITRPTADRAKESLFNILAPELPNAKVLDLFAGTGALGIEALSRHAGFCLFVEQHQSALKCLEQNLVACKIPSNQFLIIKAEVSQFLSSPRRFLQQAEATLGATLDFDLILSDPPYLSAWYDTAIVSLQASGICEKQALAVFEMEKSRALATTSPYWELEEARTYGIARFEFWRHT